ncbi:MAG: Gfo/Idh/MocA family oxidoreductase [Alphaproteobacteria bacterium]|nr:MAG: Gfo/Idh/MocA family oxidoreductase [Alphaproteobacteria bacterium]
MKRTEVSARTATVTGKHQGRVRVGVIGAGVFGGYHAQKFASSLHAEFVGVFDLNQEAAGKVIAKVGQGEVFGSFEAIANACDALVIATPASSHATLTRRALEAGKHALVEKPLALTGVEARGLAKLALEKDLVLSVGHQERLVFEAMGLFSTGERPLRIEGVRMGPASPDGRCEDVSVVFDLMIHDLDLTAELFGGEVKGVDGGGFSAHTRLLDQASAELLFANNGHAKLTASRCAEKRERWMKIEYASGVVEIDFVTRQVKNTTKFDIRADVSQMLPDPLKAADEAFIAAIQGRAAPVITGGVGARAAAMAEMVETCAMAATQVAAA